jgi:hypothetical protein
MQDHRDSNSFRPTEPERPDAFGDTELEGPGQPAVSSDPGFVDPLGFGGSLAPSLLRYPGPRDYCGFEAPVLGEAEEWRLDGILTPSRREAPHDRVTIDWNLNFGSDIARVGPTHRRVPQPGRASDRQGASPSWLMSASQGRK